MQTGAPRHLMKLGCLVDDAYRDFVLCQCQSCGKTTRSCTDLRTVRQSHPSLSLKKWALAIRTGEVVTVMAGVRTKYGKMCDAAVSPLLHQLYTQLRSPTSTECLR